MGGDTVFLVRDVSKRYGSREILSNLSFEVQKGEILGLIGASGAGKTTLLHMLVGFIPSSSGTILFHAYTHKGVIECNVLDHHKLVNTHYGFASQRPSFYEQLTVMENLEYFGAMYNLSKETVARNAEVLLRLMDLKASAHLLAAHLSGGMQRRLDIACALIHNPPILILDEPTADLDPVLRTQIWEVVKRINSRGTTILLSSHHLNELDTLCHRIAILKDGKLVDVDTPQKLKSKYSKTQELMIETFPGNYDAIIRKLHAHNIKTVKHEGTYLTVTTENPEHLISVLLTLLHRMNESLLDLKLIKPSLDDVFVTVYKRAQLDDGKLHSEPVDAGLNSVSDNALKTIVEQLKETSRLGGTAISSTSSSSSITSSTSTLPRKTIEPERTESPSTTPKENNKEHKEQNKEQRISHNPMQQPHAAQHTAQHAAQQSKNFDGKLPPLDKEHSLSIGDLLKRASLKKEQQKEQHLEKQGKSDDKKRGAR